MEETAQARAEIALLEAAIDRFCEQPLPDGFRPSPGALDQRRRNGPAKPGPALLSHHWMVHEGQCQLVKTDDGQILAIPPQLNVYKQLARGPGGEVA
jgi:hypothetical protein